MLCKNPFIKDAMAYGCGQCLPCRVKKRSEWTSRILLEALMHEHNAFVTLTYAPEHLPLTDKGLGTLNPDHLKDWQKRLSYHAGKKLRFYSVGEYGDETHRPHYHAAVFGLPGCSSYNKKCPCMACETLRRSWKHGNTLNGTLTSDSAAYVAGYVTKKMTDRKPEEKYERLLKKDPKVAANYKKHVLDVLNGRHPEFARMSLGTRKNGKGGIGKPALDLIKGLLWSSHGNQLMTELNDVPDFIKIGGKKRFLGSYLKSKLREELNVTETDKKNKAMLLRQEKIEDYYTYRQELENPAEALSQKEYLLDKHLQKVRSLEKRYKIHSKKGEL